MTSEVKYLLYDGLPSDLRQQTDLKLSWQVPAMTNAVYVAAKSPVVVTFCVCFHFTKQPGHKLHMHTILWLHSVSVFINYVTSEMSPLEELAQN